MKQYANSISGISAYANGKNYIDIQFKNNSIYRYHSSFISASHIKEMKRLAQFGKGLNTYINQHAEIKNNAIQL